MSHRLQTNRLDIREVQLDDVPAIYGYSGAEGYNRHIPAERPTINQTRRRVELFHRSATESRCRRLFLLMAEVKGGGPIVGELSLVRSSESVAEIGWGVAPSCWSGGFGTEIAESGLAFGFKELGLHRIEARVAPKNTPSLRILEKLGFEFEGLSRECRWARGQWWSLAHYGILEYEADTR